MCTIESVPAASPPPGWLVDPWTVVANQVGQTAACMAMGLPNSMNINCDEVAERVRIVFLEAVVGRLPKATVGGEAGF